jgi:transcriptional regulator of arginine metabolism
VSRREREAAILGIVADRPIHTQAELVEALATEGIEVTQATVSRDIKRLGLVKVPTPSGAYRYAPAEALEELAPAASEEDLRHAFSELVTGIDRARGIIIVRTYTGAANAVGVALDEARIPGVAGTLAGDDTVFVLTRTDRDERRVLDTLAGLMA